VACRGWHRRRPPSISHRDHQMLPGKVAVRKRRSPTFSRRDRALYSVARSGARASEAARDPSPRWSRDRSILGIRKSPARGGRRPFACEGRRDVHSAPAPERRIAMVERPGTSRAPPQRSGSSPSRDGLLTERGVHRQCEHRVTKTRRFLSRSRVQSSRTEGGDHRDAKEEEGRKEKALGHIRYVERRGRAALPSRMSSSVTRICLQPR
jgi:hypothetical protein